jgi:hypothetical protein
VIFETRSSGEGLLAEVRFRSEKSDLAQNGTLEGVAGYYLRGGVQIWTPPPRLGNPPVGWSGGDAGPVSRWRPVRRRWRRSLRAEPPAPESGGEWSRMLRSSHGGPRPHRIICFVTGAAAKGHALRDTNQRLAPLCCCVRLRTGTVCRSPPTALNGGWGEGKAFSGCPG